MPGLLDFLNDDPQSTGLMGLAQGLLAAGAPQTRRVGLGEALGLGLKGMTDSQDAYANRKYKLALANADSGNPLLTRGGSTGVLVQQYMDATGASFPEALQAVQTGFRQNMLLQNGQLSPIAGAAEGKGALKYGETMGGKQAELAMNPAIAGGEQAARLGQELQFKPRIEAATKVAETAATGGAADSQAVPVIDQLRTFNQGSFDMPYAGALSGAMRVLPSKEVQGKLVNQDLLTQARLDLAAPLAKQLGVNPTDRDFQASLDRIFNVNASKESRAAQIDALEQRIRMRQAARGGQSQSADWLTQVTEPQPQAAPAVDYKSKYGLR